MKRTIKIDLDVHRRIEAGRKSFDENENAILRRLLGLDTKRPAAGAVIRAPRSSGAYSILLGELPIEANSLKELLRRAILVGEKRRPGTIEKLSRAPTRSGRRLVARSAEAVYPKAPHLVEYAEKLGREDWWYDTNVGRTQVQSYLRLLASELELPDLPEIVKRAEKTGMTAEALGL